MGRWHRIAAVAAGLSLVGCAELAPLRLPPSSITEDLEAGTPKEAIISRYGEPDDVRQGPEGEILVYRRILVTDKTPNRFYGQIRRDRLERGELLLLFLDQDGRLLRWEAQDYQG